MKRIRKIGLCLIASFALVALFAAAAQAKHANTGPLKFTAVTASAPSLEPEGGTEAIVCSSGSAAGEITSAVSGHLTEVFTGCETEGRMCNSAGQPAGTIQTEELATETGYINRAKGEAGTLFKPASAAVLAKFDCPGSPDIYIAVKESVIGRLEPANVLATTSAFNLKGAIARQEVERFERGPKDTLIFQVSTTGQAGWEKGEFLASTGDQNAEWLATNAEQVETKGKKTKRYPDAAKVITTGARPQYARCRKAHAAKWKNSACTERAGEKNGKSSGHYELFLVPS